ncbi:hypothetical protein ABL78_3385 [Leptomonas seymouri]|uniref:Uncharacterized protein n=1 Tax=Leptomonas seymouri TaxID=5684 RepID=A0A0N1ILC9_LEPSE|nr:hypothetical protein ABL78_3385 [Leptomonas seymouri]|eukprot:KPI87542.1 hypothetical protein ABL78_3385 [Leptomonas seymouri]
MDYLLGVLYATKKYEFLDTSRLQPGINVSSRLVDGVGTSPSQMSGGGGAGDDSDRSNIPNCDSAIPANMARRSTARPFSSPSTAIANISEGLYRKRAVDSPSGAAAVPDEETSLSGEGDGAAGAKRRLSAMSANLPDSRRLSSSFQEGGAGTSYSVFSQPRESEVLSPILPGLSVSTAAIAAAAAAAEGIVNTGASIPRPQRLEYSVPTKVLSGKYVLIYLPAPHRSTSAGPATQLWGGSPGSGMAGTHQPSGAGTGGNAGGGGTGGGNRTGGHQSGSTMLSSPQLESLKVRLGGSTPTSSLLPSASPHMMPQGGPGRTNFSSALGKASDPFSSGGGSTGGHPHGPNAAAVQPNNSQPLPLSAMRAAAAAAATTHQRLLLFYCLLLRRLANRPIRENELASLLEGEEGPTVTTTQVPVAVLELHCIIEGPLRNNVFGPVTTAGSNQATSDGHGGATSSGSAGGAGAGTGGGGGGGGGNAAAGGVPAGSAGSGQHGFNPSPRSPLTSLNHSTQYSGCGGGRSTSVHLVSSMNSDGNANIGGFSTTTPSAMASPRFLTPGFRSSSAGGYLPLLDGSPAVDVAAELTPSRLLRTILQHLQEGKPDVWLSPENVVFDSEITQNPYYGGWYSVESNNGYRRVMQLCGVQSWPAVILMDPAGNVVTDSVLQHVEEELAQFTAELELNFAKKATARAVTLTEAATAAATALADFTPTDSSSATPIITVEGQLVLYPAVKGEAADEGAQRRLSCINSAADEGEEAPSPAPSMPREVSALDTRSVPEGNADFTVSPHAASSSPAAPDAEGGGKSGSMPDRSGTNPLAPATERMVMDFNTADTETDTPNQFNDSKTTSVDMHDLSIPFDDPRVPTAEPTPLKQVPTTARYRDSSSSPVLPLSAEMTSPHRRGNSDDCMPHMMPDISPSSSISQAALAATAVQHTSTSEEQKPEEAKLGGTEPFLVALKKSDSWAGEKGSEDVHERSTSLSMLTTSQPLMPNQQGGCAAKSVSTNCYFPTIFAADCAPLPNWDPKACGNNVAGVIAMHGADLKTDAPIYTASESPSAVDEQRVLPQQHHSQQCRTLQDSPSRGAGGDGKGGGRDGASSALLGQPNSSSQHAAFCGESQRVEVSASTSKVSHDFMAAASGVSVIPPLPSPMEQLPAFKSQFPWNPAMPEPIMVYTMPTLLKHSKEGGREEGNVESPQKAFQRHVQERVAERKRRESAAAHAAGQKPSPPTAVSKDECGAATATAAVADHNLSMSEGSCTAGGGQTNVGASSSSELAATASSSPSAAVVMPSTMVFRQSTKGLVNHAAAGGSCASPLDGGGSPMIASGDNAALQNSPMQVPTALLEPSTFEETSPLVTMERSWPVSPLRRLVLCSITVEQAAERMQTAANNSNNKHVFLGSDGDSKTSQSDWPASAAAFNVTAAPGASPNSLVMLSLSSEDSTDDGNCYSRSSSPLSHIARQYVPRPQRPPESEQHQLQRMSSTLFEGWLHDITTKLELSTHLVLLFGAGWHPGMSKCVRALRHLQASVNGRSSNGAKGADGETVLSNGGCGGADRQVFDVGHDAVADADDGVFPALNSFNGNSTEWPPGGYGSLSSGGRRDMRGFGNLNMSEGDPMEDEDPPRLLGRASFQRGRFHSVSPSGVLAVEPPPPPSNNVEIPRYRMQIIYVSADESLEEMCRAVSEMPQQWLCLSPCTAQSTAEYRLQRFLCDSARRIFRVTSFPQLAVLELPTAQQAQSSSNKDAMSKASTAAGERGGVGVPCGDEEADSKEFSVNTTSAMSTIQHQQTEGQFEGMWTVVQLHGEMQLNADPDGRQFPWFNGQSDVLRITQDDLATLSHEGQRAWCCLLRDFQQHQAESAHATLLHQSPVVGCSSPGDAKRELSLIGLQSDVQAAVDREDETSIMHAPLPPSMPVARLFPPLRPFEVGNGALPMLLERGGYFVVLGGFGSIDAQLHQQCVSALEEVRTWFYAELEALKEQAWSQPTRLQVMAPHGTYATSFIVGGDRLVLSPAVLGSSGEEYGAPARYSAGIPASAAASVLGGGGPAVGTVSMASVLRSLHGGANSGSAASGNISGGSASRSNTPILLDEVLPEGRALNTSPKFGLMNSPSSGGPGGLQLDGSISGHNLQLSHVATGGSGAGGGSKATAARPLPSVFFYDSILTNPHNAHMQNGHAVAARAAAVGDNDGLEQVSVSLWGSGSPMSARATSTVAAPDSPPRETSAEVTAGALNAASPSPVPVPHASDNTASLRRRHAKDLALLQEYIIAPIFENDERMLPAREGEVYLALVQWPQRTAAVLRRRLASEAKATTANTTGGGSAAAPGAVTSTAAGGCAASSSAACANGGTSAAPFAAVGSSSSAPCSRGAGTSQFPGQTQLLSEAPLRCRSGSPSVLSPPNGVVAGAGAGCAPGHPGAQAPSAVSASLVAVPTTNASTGDPISSFLAAPNAYTPAGMSLSATMRTDGSGKEASPDPDATPVASAEAIRSFLYEQILRPIVM